MSNTGPSIHPSSTDAGGPASIHRQHVNPRREPNLPPGLSWPKQKHLCCPKDLLRRPLGEPPRLRSELGYVFCHRGLYEPSQQIVENTASSMEHGLQQGYFLHEFDALVASEVHHAIVSHDLDRGHNTSQKGPWNQVEHKPSLVTRGVKMSPERVDYASTYLSTDEKVLGILDLLWPELDRRAGRTVQIDLREEDLAKTMAWYSFHISKQVYQKRERRGLEYTHVYRLFKTTMLKGYSIHFASFDILQEKIKEFSNQQFGANYFDSSHLHLFPPLIMVFFPDDLIKLAKKTVPTGDNPDRMSYDHLKSVFMKQVESFVRIQGSQYSFILNIGHTGLGLGYNKKTHRAKNPLNGDDLEIEDVIYQSRVDRAMIDVSLELRKRYRELVFSSCTRSADETVQGQNYKRRFRTGKLDSWEDGERGLSSKLKAMHGGLYPRSDLVVADDPAAEIAVRAWIEAENLDRSQLLHKTYEDWLRSSSEAYINVGRIHKGGFRPNNYGDPTSAGMKAPAPIRGLSRQSTEPMQDKVANYLQGLEGGGYGELKPATDAPEAEAEATERRGHKRYGLASPEVYRAVETLARALEGGYNINSVAGEHGRELPWSTPLMAACASDQSSPLLVELIIGLGADVDGMTQNGFPLEMAARKGHIQVVEVLLRELERLVECSRLSRKNFTRSALHEACQYGHTAIVELLLGHGADVAAPGGPYGTALIAACVGGNLGIVNILLAKNADVHAQGGRPLSALHIACKRGDINIATRLFEAGAIYDFPLDNAFTAEIRYMLRNRPSVRVNTATYGLQRTRQQTHRNCGCPLCWVDQVSQPKLSQHDIDVQMSETPLQYTLNNRTS